MTDDERRERKRAQSRAGYLIKKQDPEWYARMLANGRRYRAVNRDRLAELTKAYKADPVRKAHFAAYQREQRAKQGSLPREVRPEYDCIGGARNANNRARRGAYPGRVTTAEVREVMATGVCADCGSTAQPTLDHIVPLSRGGPNVRANLQRLCFPCNSGKRDSAPVEVAA